MAPDDGKGRRNCNTGIEILSSIFKKIFFDYLEEHLVFEINYFLVSEFTYSYSSISTKLFYTI